MKILKEILTEMGNGNLEAREFELSIFKLLTKKFQEMIPRANGNERYELENMFKDHLSEVEKKKEFIKLSIKTNELVQSLPEDLKG